MSTATETAYIKSCKQDNIITWTVSNWESRQPFNL
uniref:Uncharacterized protein n=1 Tax=Siphoviridae sp. ctnPP24 TaxID=2825662 RepID=A0A8S5TYY5_9CAUD|nr:MAG TPA: hypothetical protein [Siphoviridae sp. ctnPP24]